MSPFHVLLFRHCITVLPCVIHFCSFIVCFAQMWQIQWVFTTAKSNQEMAALLLVFCVRNLPWVVHLSVICWNFPFEPGTCFQQSVSSSFFTKNLLKSVALPLMEIIFSLANFHNVVSSLQQEKPKTQELQGMFKCHRAALVSVT